MVLAHARIRCAMAAASEDLDQLARSTYFIPCNGAAQAHKSTRARQLHAQHRKAVPEIGLQRLEAFENDEVPARRRESNLRAAHRWIDRAFKHGLASVHAPTLSALKHWADENTSSANSGGEASAPSFWLPQPSNGPVLRTVLLKGGARVPTQILKRMLTCNSHPAASSGPRERDIFLQMNADDYETHAQGVDLFVRLVRRACAAGGFWDEHAHDAQAGGGGPSRLATLWSLQRACKARTVFLSLPEVSEHPLGALQDLLQALHSFFGLSQGWIHDRAPRLCIIFSDSRRCSASSKEENDLASHDLPLPATTKSYLDVHAIDLPDDQAVWEAVVQSLWFRPREPPPLLVSYECWAQLETKYKALDADIETIRQALKLIALQHFSTCSASALLSLTSSSDALRSSNFNNAFFVRLRLALIHSIQERSSVPPRPSWSVTSSSGQRMTGDLTPGQHLKRLLEDDEYLLETCEQNLAVSAQHQSATSSALLAIDLLSSLSDVANSRGQSAFSASEVWRILLKNGDQTDRGSSSVSHLVQPLLTFLRSLDAAKLIERLKVALLTLRQSTMQVASGDHADALQNGSSASLQLIDMMQSWITQLGSQSSVGTAGDEDSLLDGDAANHFQDVHRKLLQEESMTTSKRKVINSISSSLRSMLKQALTEDPLTRLAKRFDSPEFVSAKLDGHLRSTLLHALNHPFDAVRDGLLRHRTLAESLRVSGERTEETLGVIRERSEMPMPDVCVAYSLYRDSGRMINLADWYDAFTQQISLPLSSSRATFADDQQNSRKRPSSASAGGEDGQTEGAAGMEARPEDLDQTRFACAVHELASLGLLRRTRRKAEHVLKTIWDLPPAPSFGHVPDTA